MVGGAGEGERAMTSTTQRMNKAAEPYKVIVLKTMHVRPQVLRHADPVEAAATAVEYLRRGYWVRLSDHTVSQFEAEHAMMRLRDRIARQERP